VLLSPRLVAPADIPSLPKSKRNQHIQACARREIASKREYLQTDVHYCHQCFNWVIGSKEWEAHCQTHIDALGSKRCGTITYCHTLVPPAYCPFCLGDTSDSASQRLESWCRDYALWQHVDKKHLHGCEWPRTCPNPLCDVSLSDGLDLHFHFIDEHGLSRTVPKDAKNLGTTTPHSEEEQVPPTKRKALEDNVELSWPSPNNFHLPILRRRSDYVHRRLRLRCYRTSMPANYTLRLLLTLQGQILPHTHPKRHRRYG